MPAFESRSRQAADYFLMLHCFISGAGGPPELRHLQEASKLQMIFSALMLHCFFSGAREPPELRHLQAALPIFLGTPPHQQEFSSQTLQFSVSKSGTCAWAGHFEFLPQVRHGHTRTWFVAPQCRDLGGAG